MKPRDAGFLLFWAPAVLWLVMAAAGTVANAQGNTQGQTATLPYVAPAGSGHPSLLRILNDTTAPITVQVTGYDDTGRRFGPQPLTVPGIGAVSLTSTELEQGGRGNFAGLGDGTGWWRLVMAGSQPFRTGMYYRTGDGFLAELTRPIPGREVGSGRAYDVDFFNPASNTAKVSILRLANPQDTDLPVQITGWDDLGNPGEEILYGPLPARAGVTFTAQELEEGAEGFRGRLGDGEGKWRLEVRTTQPIHVMSLLRATGTGHLANLSAIAQSTATATVPEPEPQGCPDTAGFNARVTGKRVVLSDSVVRFQPPSRLSQTFTEYGVTWAGSYTYRKTGLTAAMTIRFDNGERCGITLTCSAPTEGTLRSDCRGNVLERWRILP